MKLAKIAKLATYLVAPLVVLALVLYVRLVLIPDQQKDDQESE